MSAITVVTFILYFVAIAALTAAACWARIRYGKFEISHDRVILHRSAYFGVFPVLIPVWESTLKEHGLEVRPVVTVSMRRIRHINFDPTRESVHQDQGYIKRFGWFSARYRRTRWWFLAYYSVYLVGRAGFLGAGASSPLAQVYGLLLFEICAFTVMIILNPFEGSRNTALAVWMLSISKITTTGLSIAFLPALKLDRIVATVIGIILIIVQGLLVIGALILVILSAISSWMSLTRNREEMGAEHFENVRVKYFEHIEAKAPDTYRPPKPKADKRDKGKDVDETYKEVSEPIFSVVSVRREPKDEDDYDDNDIIHDLEPPKLGANGDGPLGSRGPTRVSRANSVSSQRSVHSLPRGLRNHQSNWPSPLPERNGEDVPERTDSLLAHRLAENEGRSRSATPAGDAVRRMGSRQSLGTLSGRPNSPFSPGLNTPSRDTLARYAEERRYPTPQPTIPDLE